MPLVSFANMKALEEGQFTFRTQVWTKVSFLKERYGLYLKAAPRAMTDEFIRTLFPTTVL